MEQHSPKSDTAKDENEAKLRHNALKQILLEVLAIKTVLADERRANKTFPVIGEGSHFAKLMLVGEAPGKNESLTGKPFCGASGKFLDQLLAHAGIARADVYVTNIVKDRPTDNRDPLLEEIEAYGSFLDRQIDIIQPKIIGTLGRFSMIYVMKRLGLESEILPISKAHGMTFTAKASYGDVIIMPFYHPAVALYNGSNREVLLEDFLKLKGRV